MNTPHKHAEVIKAWADGAEIEFRCPGKCEWDTLKGGHLQWYNDMIYRVKPEQKLSSEARMKLNAMLSTVAYAQCTCRADLEEYILSLEIKVTELSI